MALDPKSAFPKRPLTPAAPTRRPPADAAGAPATGRTPAANLHGELSRMLANRESATREFVFSSTDFERVRKLIHQYAGISLSPVKKDMVYSRLARRLRALGKSTFNEYLDMLTPGSGDEWEKFVNSLTTNLTSFFREPHHFPILAEHLRKIGSQRPIKIWCSAASTGEEPYSIAMTVLETFGAEVNNVSILATDLDTNVLATARKGVYGMERLERLSPERLRRFFLRGTGSQEGFAAVRPEVKRLVEFRQLNLLDSKYAVPTPVDVMFCRNVMIYFDKPTQYKILSRFAPMLQPDGLLFAGHSESFLHAADLFRSQGKTVYVLTASAEKDASATRIR